MKVPFNCKLYFWKEKALGLQTKEQLGARLKKKKAGLAHMHLCFSFYFFQVISGVTRFPIWLCPQLRSMNPNKRGPGEALPSPEVLDWEWVLVDGGNRVSKLRVGTDSFLLKTTFYPPVKPLAASVQP